jgi:hypothetical protein
VGKVFHDACINLRGELLCPDHYPDIFPGFLKGIDPSSHSQCKGLTGQERSDCEYNAAQEDVHATYGDL